MNEKVGIVCFISLLICCGFTAWGDLYQRDVDSITALLFQRNTPHEAHQICMIGSLHYRNFNFDEGLKHAAEAMEIGERTGDEPVIIRAHRLFADIYYAMAEYDLSLKHFEAELEIHERNADTLKIAEVNCNIGVVYDVRGFLEKGFYHYLKALLLYEVIDEKEGLVATLSNIAHIHRGKGNYPEAIRYFGQASQIEMAFLENKKPHYFLVNIAEDYKNLGEFAKAKELLEEAGSILKSLSHPDDEDLLIWIDKARVQGIVYRATGDLQQALAFFREALEKATITGYREKEGPVLVMMAGLLIEMGDLPGAKTFLDKARAIAIETGSFAMQRNAYSMLSQLAEKQGNMHQALDYLRQYNQANDSVINIESAKRMSEMQVTFESERKEAQIRLLQQENEIQQLRTDKMETQRRLTLLIALVLLLIAGLYHNRYRLKKQSAVLLGEKNDQLALLNATKDKFFTIIAHDLKNPLLSFRNITLGVKNALPDLSQKDLFYYINEIHQSASHLHDLLSNLLHWSKSQSGLVKSCEVEFKVDGLVSQALKSFETDIHLKRLKLTTAVDPDLQLRADKNVVATVLRNILSNAIKFSDHEGEVIINVITKGDDAVHFEVTDSGPGLSKEDLEKLFRIDADTKSIGAHTGKKGTGLGLILCKELVDKAGGQIRAVSGPGKGSTFSFSFPA